MDKIYEKYHKFPRGLKKKLTEFYGLDKPRCCLCWSGYKIAIHHYMHRIEDKHYRLNSKYRYRQDTEGNAIFDELDNFILVCPSCHGKIHSCQEWFLRKGDIDGKKIPPFLEMVYAYMELKHPKLKGGVGADSSHS